MEESRNERLTKALELYEQLEGLIVRTANRADLLRNSVLVLSVITSGSLWLLISETLPKGALWFGAIASTVVTIVTLYLASAGVNRMREQALTLHTAVARFIAEIRSRPLMGEAEFWDRYKAIEDDIFRLRHGRHGE